MEDLSFKNYRGFLIYICLIGVSIFSLSFLKTSEKAADFWVENLSGPFKLFVAKLCSFVDLSIAELLFIAFCLFIIVFLVYTVINFFKKNRGEKTGFLVKQLSLAVSLAMTVWLLLTALWGINYYSSTFSKKSGINPVSSSVDELASITEYFAEQVNLYSKRVKRDYSGIFYEDIDLMFSRSLSVYENIEQRFPFLKSDPIMPKKVYFSKTLSRLSTTGITFPLTGEANINTDVPTLYIPVTIIHEMAHQKNIASEQDADFIAVISCIESDDDIFRYSGYMYGFRYLSNALYKVDSDKYFEVFLSLNQEVLDDYSFNREYWIMYDGKISEMSDNIYDSYLKSQGQDLGIRSYGEIADLLIAYYRIYPYNVY